MRKKRRGIGTIFLILISLLFFFFQKPVPQISKRKANFEFTAPELYEQYQYNESKSNRQLLDKIILVTGTVKMIIAEDNQLSVVLDGSNEEGGVVCEMDKRLITTSPPQPGQVVTIKGVCSGMLMHLDLVLTRCLLIT